MNDATGTPRSLARGPRALETGPPMITETETALAARLRERYGAVRARTEELVAPLSPEDCTVQSMPEASPVRWHLAHTTWFFETFVLERAHGYEPWDPAYRVLFNSYYNAVGEPYPRPQRGWISRPSLEEILAYRRGIDERVQAALERPERLDAELELLSVVELGLNHEEQHQELLLADVKHAFAQNPLHPAYHGRFPAPGRAPVASGALGWVGVAGGVHEIGAGPAGFAFDNERPRHRVFLEDFELGSRLVTNGEFRAFVEAGGYRRPELWLSEGWRFVNERGWRAPLYWVELADGWHEFTLAGLRPLEPTLPVAHLSLFEADAYARFALARLPTEAEWEVASARAASDGSFAEAGLFHPAPVRAAARETLDAPAQMAGELWQWTSSSYAPYPGYAPAAGALGEYNGKFMCNQYVLRGASCATPRAHARASYRNFFPADARWQFAGLRLAR